MKFQSVFAAALLAGGMANAIPVDLVIDGFVDTVEGFDSTPVSVGDAFTLSFDGDVTDAAAVAIDVGGQMFNRYPLATGTLEIPNAGITYGMSRIFVYLADNATDGTDTFDLAVVGDIDPDELSNFTDVFYFVQFAATTFDSANLITWLSGPLSSGTLVTTDETVVIQTDQGSVFGTCPVDEICEITATVDNADLTTPLTAVPLPMGGALLLGGLGLLAAARRR